MADTFNKKALQQKKAKKKQDKLERKEERKSNNDKGKSLDEMTVYLDEFGNLTDIPPDQQKRKKIKIEDIQLGAAPIVDEDATYSGTIALFFEDKNYGFITEDNSRESIFVHGNNIPGTVSLKDKVTYEKEKTAKGYAAINVKIIK